MSYIKPEPIHEPEAVSVVSSKRKASPIREPTGITPPENVLEPKRQKQHLVRFFRNTKQILYPTKTVI